MHSEHHKIRFSLSARISLLISHLLLFFSFGDRVLLCSPNWPRTHYETSLSSNSQQSSCLTLWTIELQVCASIYSHQTNESAGFLPDLHLASGLFSLLTVLGRVWHPSLPPVFTASSASSRKAKLFCCLLSHHTYHNAWLTVGHRSSFKGRCFPVKRIQMCCYAYVPPAHEECNHYVL